MTRPALRDRTMAALVAGGLVALLLWVLVLGLAVGPRGAGESALKLFAVIPSPPPAPPPPAPRRTDDRASGAAAPPNLRSQATALVAPVPAMPVPPSPLVVAPVAFASADASQGAAAIAGPGTGGGGQGNGRGAGGWGDGDGAGDVPPRRIKGRIKDADYPHDASEQGASGVVGVRYVVAIDGRVPQCEVTRSSGNASLDATTCRLIMRRFRFKPGHDAQGRPFVSRIVENQEWIIPHESATDDAGRAADRDRPQ